MTGVSLPGYVPVVTARSLVAHLRHPTLGFACPNGRDLVGPWRRASDAIPLCRKCARRQKRPAPASIAGRNPPPWNVAMREILQDGDWHEIRELAYAGMHTIPPNKAMSWFIDHVAPQRKPEWAAVMSPREKIKAGRYNLAVRVITDWITERVVEADRPPRRKGRRVRLVAQPRPGAGRGSNGRYQ